MTNPPQISRRRFVHAASVTTLAAGLAETWASLADGREPHRIVSIRDLHLRLTGEANCWAALKCLGVRAIEMLVDDQLTCPGLYHPDKTFRVATSDDCQALQSELAEHGIEVTALAMSNRFDERLEREMEWLEATVQVAERLHVPVIRIDVVPHRLTPDAFLPFAVRLCQRLGEMIKSRPVRLGIENHGQMTNRRDFLDQLLDGAKSEQIGLTLDLMNFYWFGYPLSEVYDLCRRFAPRAFHTHCKNLDYPPEKRDVRRPTGWQDEEHAAPLDQGNIDYTRVAACLREAKYTSDLCLENECLGRFPKSDHVAILKREIALLHRLS